MKTFETKTKAQTVVTIEPTKAKAKPQAKAKPKAKRVYVPTALVKMQKKYNEEFRSLGAVCRWIDNEVKHTNKTLVGTKDCAIKFNTFKQLENKGAFKLIQPLLTTKQKDKMKIGKQLFSPWSLIVALNKKYDSKK